MDTLPGGLYYADMRNQRLLTWTSNGLYCEAGDFYIDPRGKVERAVITHAHSDHARAGSQSYLTTTTGRAVLQTRLPKASIETLDYGKHQSINGVDVSFHPAGHVLGSAQVRVEHRGEVWVVSGDYKLQTDPTCAPLEPVKCDTFVTEATFALPIYRWDDSASVMKNINEWWQNNKNNNVLSVLFGYSFGKAQRILAGIDASIGPILVSKEIEKLNVAYEATGVKLPSTGKLPAKGAGQFLPGTLVLAPPSGKRSWLKHRGQASCAFASGWMRITRRGYDQGFVLSDHADWDGLLSTIKATGASEILTGDGSAETLARYLKEQGLNASCLKREDV